MQKIKLIVCGGRDYCNYAAVKNAIDSFREATQVSIVIVCGRCSVGTKTFTAKDGTVVCGADGLAERYAEENNIEVELHPADWKKFGKSAGYIRNKEMAQSGTHCLAFWDGMSRGTKMMIDLSHEHRLVVEVVRI